MRRLLSRGRPDDTADVIRHRYREVYLGQTVPVRDHYRSRGVPEEVIDGVGDVDEIAGRLATACDRLAGV